MLNVSRFLGSIARRPVSQLTKLSEQPFSKSVTSLSSHHTKSSIDAVRYFSDNADKNKNFNYKQRIVNVLASSLTNTSYINTEKSDGIIISKDFEKFLKKENFVQIHRCCLHECAIVLDSYHGDRKSFMFTDYRAKGLTSLTTGQARKTGDTEYENYLKQTQSIESLARIEQGHNMEPIAMRLYIEEYVGHKVLTSLYISGKRLQEHFENNPNQPLYCFCEWGDSRDKAGYYTHAILIYGVNDKQEIHYYDVSDKLDTQKYSRFRVMDIDEFNDRRDSYRVNQNFLDPRSPIFYKGE